MKRLMLTLPLVISVPLAWAMDVSEYSSLTASVRMALHGNDEFGDVIGHELPEYHEQMMHPLESSPGVGVSLAFRRGISSSVLFGVCADYLVSGKMKGKGVDQVEARQAREDSTSKPLGSYKLYGVGLSLYPGVSVTEALMLFGEVGLGAYSARIAGHTQDMNACLNVGALVTYLASDRWGIELAARMPLFMAEFVFMEQHYTLSPSPLQFSLGLSRLF